MKKMQAIELNCQKIARLSAVFEGVGNAMENSAAQKCNAAAMVLKMRLIGKAGLSNVEKKVAHKALLDDFSTNNGCGNSGLGDGSAFQRNTPGSSNGDEGSGESNNAAASFDG